MKRDLQAFGWEVEDKLGHVSCQTLAVIRQLNEVHAEILGQTLTYLIDLRGDGHIHDWEQDKHGQVGHDHPNHRRLVNGSRDYKQNEAEKEQHKDDVRSQFDGLVELIDP